MPEKSTEKANDAFIKVFLSSETRTRFKVNCAKAGVAMSEKARELIEQWNEHEEAAAKNKGDVT